MPRKVADLKIQEEISILATKVSDIETQLKEERKIHTRLLYDMDAKIAQISKIDVDIREEEESFCREQQNIVQETAAIERMKIRKIAEIDEMRTELEEEVASCDVVEHGNQFLHNELKAAADTYERLHMHYEREYENKKQHCFDTRMAMEQVLRNEIKNLDINFKTNAVVIMDHEADVANNENHELYAELHRREELSRELIANQQNTYDLLQKLQIEQEVMKTTAQSHEVGITELKDFVYAQHKTMSKLKEQLENLQTSVSKHQTILTRKLAHSETLVELDTKLQSILKRKDHYKHRALKCVGRLSEEVISAVEDEQRQYTYDLVDMVHETPPSPMTAPATPSQPATPSINADAVWKCTLQPLPQLTGTLRTAMLQQLKTQKTAKATKLPHVSTSMTYHK